MTVTQNNNSLGPGFWIGLVLVVIALLFTTTKCHAQSDTIPCKVECIKNTVITTTTSGTDRVYVVYSDEKLDIQDMIYIPKSVYNYMEMCKKNKIVPSLGIRFKNGQIVSIVRYKKHYKIKK